MTAQAHPTVFIDKPMPSGMSLWKPSSNDGAHPLSLPGSAVGRSATDDATADPRAGRAGRL